MNRTPRRRANIALIVVCQSVQAMAYGGVALFLPLIRADLGLSFTQAGALAAASSLVYALMQIPSGYLADRFTPRRLFLIGLLGTNALAFSFSVLRSYELLLLNQALSGMFRALVFAPGMLLMSSHFAPSKRATAMGLYVAGGFSSNILLNSTGPFLVDPLGWRWLFVIFATAGFAVLGAYAWIGRHSEQRPANQGARLRDLSLVMRRPALWVIGGIQFIRLAVVQGLAFWMPTYLLADKGFPLTTAGLVVALGAAVTAPSNFLGGYLSDRLHRPFAVIGTSLAILATTIVLLPTVHTLPQVVAVVAVNSIFVQLYFGPLFSVAIDYLGARTAGLTSGFGNFWANIGGFTLVYMMGIMKDRTGSFGGGLYLLAGMCVVGLVATAGLAHHARTHPLAVQDQSPRQAPQPGPGDADPVSSAPGG